MSNTNRRSTRLFGYCVALSLLFSGLLLVWLLIKPGTQGQFVAGDDIAQTLGYLLGGLFCVAGLGRSWRKSIPTSESISPDRVAHPVYGLAQQKWVSVLIGLALLGDCLGQAIYTYYELVLHQSTPFPSWADVCFLSAYPFQVLGILLLPTRRLSGTTRWRVFLDCLVIMTAIITFSWYFILGPTTLQGSGTVLAKCVGIAYPFFDLITVCCVLLLLSRASDSTQRLAMYLLAFALVIIAISDSVSEYQALQNAYATGGIVDLGWPVGYTLIGIAVQAMSLARRRQGAQPKAPPAEKSSQKRSTSIPPSIWRSLLPYVLPYVLLPAVVLLAFIIWHTGGSGLLAQGVYFGGTVLIGLVVLRQIIVIRETKQLNDELHTVNSRLESMATTDPLTGLPNHRALLEHLDKEVERARRFGHPLAIAFFDGDRFKRVNDTYGHAIGDVVLHDLGERASSVLRTSDTLGRYGGEEFMVILPETDTGQAVIFAERMRAAVANLPLAMTHVEAGISATISIGIASYPTNGNTSSELLDSADQAMYWAKRLGRNQVRTVDEAEQASRNVTLNATIHSLERLEEAPTDGLTAEQAPRANQLGVVYSLMWLIELRDHGISIHSYEVSDLATAVAQEMGLEAKTIFAVATAGLLHDIGKIALPDTLLHKSGHLSASEWSLIKQHPELGAQILEISPFLRDLMPAVRHHHERWDGTGYPDQLSGESIPIEARLIAVAEAYHAMMTDHPYQASRSPAAALAELQRCAGVQFDPAVVQTVSALLTRRQKEVRAHEMANAV